MKKEEFMDYYSRWSSVVLVCIIALVATICLSDIIFDFGFTKNIYLLMFIIASAILAVFSVAWISILNRQKPTECVITQPAVGEERAIDLSDIEYCIRKEGYIPVRRDNYVSFKISGEEIEVFYEDEKLSFVRTYGIGEDVNLDILSKACSALHDSTFLIRSSLHRYDNNQIGLVFEIQSLVVSPKELERYFERHLNILFHSIQRHKEIYGNLLEETNARPEDKQTAAAREHKVVS